MCSGFYLYLCFKQSQHYESFPYTRAMNNSEYVSPKSLENTTIPRVSTAAFERKGQVAQGDLDELMTW